MYLWEKLWPNWEQRNLRIEGAVGACARARRTPRTAPPPAALCLTRDRGDSRPPSPAGGEGFSREHGAAPLIDRQWAAA